MRVAMIGPLRQFWAGVCAIEAIPRLTDAINGWTTQREEIVRGGFLRLLKDLGYEHSAMLRWLNDQAIESDYIPPKWRARVDNLEQQLSEARADLDALKDALNRDRTGLALGLEKVMRLVRGYSWIGDGEWDSYSHEQQTEQTLRVEIDHCLHQVHELAYGALLESGRLVDVVFNNPESLAAWKAQQKAGNDD